MKNVSVQGIPLLGATAVTSTVTSYSRSVHTTITDGYGTSMQLFGALSGPGSKVPTGGDPKFCNTTRDPSLLRVIFNVTEAISSIPAPSFQFVRVYSTSSKQKCSSTSPPPSGSHS
jgi:hypothetical protein